MSQSKGVLMAHTDTSVVTEAVVRREPAPAFTSTWHPHSHAAVIDAVDAACKKHGWEIERKVYSLKPGEKMFGVWDLKTMDNSLVKTSENTLSIGVRNSINKEMSVGLCAGERVFVCDNMVFRGDFVLFRKHTGQLSSEELFIMADEALLTLQARYNALLTWHESLKEFKLSDANASLLAVAAMRRPYPLISPSQFDDFGKLYFDDRPRYTPTLHGFHGAVTEMFQKHPMFYLMQRNERLVNFLDYEAKALCSHATKNLTINMPAIREAAEDKRKQVRVVDTNEVRAQQIEVRTRVVARLKEEKQQKAFAKKTNPEKVQATIKAAKKAHHANVVKPLMKEIEKKQRRTTRVKVREQVAKEAAPIKTKTQRAPKGEKTKTIKRVANKPTYDEDSETLFCDKCSKEFKPSELNEDRLCSTCR